MVIAGKYDGDMVIWWFEPDSESCWSDALCRLRLPCSSWRSRCRSCSTRSEVMKMKKKVITMMKLMLLMMMKSITLLVSISSLVSLTMGRLEGKEVMFKYEQSIMDSWLYLGFKVLTLISIMITIWQRWWWSRCQLLRATFVLMTMRSTWLLQWQQYDYSGNNMIKATTTWLQWQQIDHSDNNMITTAATIWSQWKHLLRLHRHLSVHLNGRELDGNGQISSSCICGHDNFQQCDYNALITIDYNAFKGQTSPSCTVVVMTMVIMVLLVTMNILRRIWTSRLLAISYLCNVSQ